MNKTELLTKISRTANMTCLKIKKHSPELLVSVGVVGVVTSTVMACKATTKLNDILNESKEQIDQINEYVEEHGFTEKYDEKDKHNDLTIVYTQSAVKLIKLYAPAAIVGTLSLSAIIGSHRILSKRNAALTAAYATIEKSFKEYRGRVIGRFGEKVDHELRHNIKAQEITETIVNGDGTETTETNTVELVDPSTYSDYARFFDDGCRGWCKDPDYNLMFLKDQQRYANDLLKIRGHLFLNDVYDMLGIPRCKAGQIVGWIYDEKNPVGDNFVDFGIYDANRPKNREFVNGYERTILLDFNVDGNILDMI